MALKNGQILGRDMRIWLVRLAPFRCPRSRAPPNSFLTTLDLPTHAPFLVLLLLAGTARWGLLALAAWRTSVLSPRRHPPHRMRRPLAKASPTVSPALTLDQQETIGEAQLYVQ